MSLVVIIDIAPNAFVVEVFNGEVLVLKKDVESFCFFEGLPNCYSFDLI